MNTETTLRAMRRERLSSRSRYTIGAALFYGHIGLTQPIETAPFWQHATDTAAFFRPQEIRPKPSKAPYPMTID
jgi:hypothetical protein